MCSSRISGEGELRGQPANPGSPGKMADKMECLHNVMNGRVCEKWQLLYIVDETPSVQLLTSYQSTSRVVTIRKPSVNIMTDFDIHFTW